MLGEGGIGGKGSVCVCGGGGVCGIHAVLYNSGQLGGWGGGQGRGGTMHNMGRGGVCRIHAVLHNSPQQGVGWGSVVGGWGRGQAGNYGIGAVLHNSVVLLVFSAETVLRVLCWV